MQLVPNSPAAFLATSDVINVGDRGVVAQSRRLTLGKADSGAIRRVYQWVRDAIPHTADLGEGPITCSASEVLAAGTGICYAKSHLLAALLRATGIPTGFCYQRLAKDPPHDGFELHALNGVYVTEWRRWVKLDARGNREATEDQPAVDAQFSPTGDRLAFAVDPEKGEKNDNRVFADPLPETIAVLLEHDTLDTLWPALPSELPGPLLSMPFGMPRG